MTVVPLPASPCVRVRLLYTNTDGSEAGSRFYLSYTGSTPSATTLNTLATDVATEWNTELATLVQDNYALTGVDVLDIATDTGNSGVWAGSHPGTISGVPVPANCAMNVEFGIARRYRGGKPRMFLPPPGQSAMADSGHWGSTTLGYVNTNVAAFFAYLEGLSIGSMGALDHVNLSYYKGFTNITNSSGRERAAPNYRASALLDPVISYTAKAEVGSQRRRRIATTY